MNQDTLNQFVYCIIHSLAQFYIKITTKFFVQTNYDDTIPGWFPGNFLLAIVNFALINSLALLIILRLNCFTSLTKSSWTLPSKYNNNSS